MSKKGIGASRKHMSSLSWLQGSTNPMEHLHHVLWEHLQIFHLKELAYVLIAHQVTSSFFCQSSEDTGSASNVRSFFVSLCFKSVG